MHLASRHLWASRVRYLFPTDTPLKLETLEEETFILCFCSTYPRAAVRQPDRCYHKKSNWSNTTQTPPGQVAGSFLGWWSKLQDAKDEWTWEIPSAEHLTDQKTTEHNFKLLSPVITFLDLHPVAQKMRSDFVLTHISKGCCVLIIVWYHKMQQPSISSLPT